jgi:hypothetical protein
MLCNNKTLSSYKIVGVLQKMETQIKFSEDYEEIPLNWENNPGVHL